MTGARGMIAANHLYNRVKPDVIDDRRLGIAAGFAAHHGQ
jgi:hypothetical protein